MDKTFEKFLRSGIDLSLIGIERREDNASYFCTPKGASIFGWAGVDGIHYCFVRGFGGMVFALTPPTIEIMGFPGGAARFIAKPCLKQRVMRFPTIRYGCSAQ